MKERRLGSLGCVVTFRSVLFPSPLVGEGGAKRRMRGLCQRTQLQERRSRREPPHPASMRASKPSSPTRGEVRISRPVWIEPLLETLPAVRIIILQRRGVRGMGGDALSVAGLEHEGERAGELDRL